MGRTSHIGSGKLVLHGKNEFMNNLGCMWGNDGCTKNDATLIGNDLYKAIAEI